MFKPVGINDDFITFNLVFEGPVYGLALVVMARLTITDPPDDNLFRQVYVSFDFSGFYQSVFTATIRAFGAAGFFYWKIYPGVRIP